MRAYVRRMEKEVLESLEASKKECSTARYEGGLKNLRDQLYLAGRRMDNFIGTTENTMAEFEVRLDHESTVNAHFRSGVQHHLCAVPRSDDRLQEDFEIISIAKNSPMMIAMPCRKSNSVTEEEQPLCPKADYDDSRHHKPCTQWPWFLRRQKT